MIFRSFGNLILVLALLFPAAVGGQTIFGEESLDASSRKVEVYAENVERKVEEDLIIAEGAVDIRTARVRLRADRVELNDKTMDLVASGNVILESGEERLQGERLEFNLNRETGFITDGQGFAEAYYFSGKRIEKLDEERYLVEQGSFTSCEGVLPDWSFRSPRALIHVGNYIYANHPSIWVKKLPVFYLPYTIVPIKRDRATGMLMPRIRVNNSDGFVVKNAFYWLQADNADATFYLDYLSQRGWQYGLEERYVFSEGTKGEFGGYFIDDDKTGSRRWDIKYLHRHELPYDLAGLVNVNINSDRSYQRDYGEDLDQFSQEELDSYASISREWEGMTFIVSGERNENLTTEKDSILTRFPEVNVKKTESKIGDTPLYWSMRTQAVGLSKEEEGVKTETGRFYLSPEITMPINIQSWASIRPSLGLDYTYYSDNLDGESEGRFLYDPQLEVVGPKLYRIFGEDGGQSRFKHIVYPSLTYRYRPDVDQEDLPKFDSIDSRGEENSITYGLTNRVLGKFREDDGSFTTREVLKLQISQYYDFNREGDEHFGNLRVDLETSPFKNLFIDGDARYDVEEASWESINYGFRWSGPASTTLFIERRYSEGSVDYIEGGVGFKKGPWDVSYRGRYDIDEASFVENIIETKYTAQCWDVSFTVIEWEDEYEYRFTLNLKEIGTIIKF